ncbi:LOW QUALITY PROTEIN: putative inactive methylesterase 20 [Vigna unguiculata]|uniref:LOW QUALITY PROTEIN: putative inactive methylesterase 20 n=1 Tax=Vigna unguiculata TaxID=3917 RepID=UPI001016AAE2|nr:LOW QUALITY PROTEIN: putative inactive methylesterase 20 [Vigna unguiculata]
MQREKKKHLVLIHYGGGHGAWCWYKVAALLKSSGHKVTALDMAASGIHPKQAEELNSISEYYEPLMEFLESLDGEERVILVGHSLGGVGVSLAMEKFPEKIAATVFVSSWMPSPDLSFFTLSQESQARRRSESNSHSKFDDNNSSQPKRSMKFTPEFLASNLYQLSPPEDLTLALSLLRPTRIFGDEEMSGENARVTEEKYGSVKRVYIMCEQDNIILKEYRKSVS